MPLLSTFSALRAEQTGQPTCFGGSLLPPAPASPKRAVELPTFKETRNPYLDASMTRPANRRTVPKWMKELGVTQDMVGTGDSPPPRASPRASPRGSARGSARAPAGGKLRRMTAVYGSTANPRSRTQALEAALARTEGADPAGGKPTWDASTAPGREASAGSVASAGGGAAGRRGLPPTSAQLAKSLSRLKVVFKSGTPREVRDALRAFLTGELLAAPGHVDSVVLSDLLDALQGQKPAVQVTAAGILLQRGCYFGAMRAVFSSPASIRAVVEEAQKTLQARASADAGDALELAAEAWVWEAADRELFVRQFARLKIIQVFRQMRSQMAALGPQGAPAIARVEREVLLKVTHDFAAQLGDAQPGEAGEGQLASQILGETTGRGGGRGAPRARPRPARAPAGPPRDRRDVEREARHRRAEERRAALLAQAGAEARAKEEARRHAAKRRRLAEAHRRVAAREAEAQRQVARERQRLAARRQLLEAELGALMAEDRYAEAYQAAYPGAGRPPPSPGRASPPRSPPAPRRAAAGPAGGARKVSIDERSLGRPPLARQASVAPEVQQIPDADARRAAVDEEIAALRIQAAFRGHHDRQRVAELRATATAAELRAREREAADEVRRVEEAMRLKELEMAGEAEKIEAAVARERAGAGADGGDGAAATPEDAGRDIGERFKEHKDLERVASLKAEYGALAEAREAAYAEMSAAVAAQEEEPAGGRAAGSYTAEEEAAALAIQRYHRGSRARAGVAEMKLERARMEAELAEQELRELAATKIQSRVRGAQARRAHAARVEEARQRGDAEGRRGGKRREAERLKVQAAALDVASRYVRGDTLPRRGSGRAPAAGAAEASGSTVAPAPPGSRGASGRAQLRAEGSEEDAEQYDWVEGAIRKALVGEDTEAADAALATALAGISRDDVGGEASAESLGSDDARAIEDVLEGAVMAVEHLASRHPSRRHDSARRAASGRPPATDAERAAAARIQAGFRGMRDRDRVQAMIEERQRDVEARLALLEAEAQAEAEAERAATRIQAAHRGRAARERVREMREARDGAETRAREAEREADRARREAEQGRREAEAEARAAGEAAAAEARSEARREEDARRGHEDASERLHRDREDELERLNAEVAAAKGEGQYRGWSGRKTFTPDERKAALRIQSSFRGHMGRRHAEAVRREIAKLEEEEMDQAATRIQAQYRGRLARREAGERRGEAGPRGPTPGGDSDEDEMDELTRMRRRLERERQRMQAVLAEKRAALEHARRAKLEKEERRRQALEERGREAAAEAEAGRRREEEAAASRLGDEMRGMDERLGQRRAAGEQAAQRQRERRDKDAKLSALQRERERLQATLDEERRQLQARLLAERAELQRRMAAEEAAERSRAEQQRHAASEIESALHRFSETLRVNQEQMTTLLSQLNAPAAPAAPGEATGPGTPGAPALGSMKFLPIPVMFGGLSASPQAAPAAGDAAAPGAGPGPAAAGGAPAVLAATPRPDPAPAAAGGAPGPRTPGGAVAPPGAAPPAPIAGVPQLDDLPEDEKPTEEEIREYAVYLGMDPDDDRDLLYIAEWAIMAPVPDGWTEHLDNDGNEYYHNPATGVSKYEHPLDEQFRSYYRQMKAQRMGQSFGDSLRLQQQARGAVPA